MLNMNRNVYLVIVVIISILLSVSMVLQSGTEKKQLINKTKENLIAERYQKKKRDIEHFFTQAYQTSRTIGLLPSVREIRGENRKTDIEDVIADGRFSAEGHSTVQQLYNNLAANINISEIYAVVDGFQKEDIPFFMYDSLILRQNPEGSEEGSGHHNEDFPEELEDEEYAHYPAQLTHFRNKFPRFNYETLDDIPAISSPPMRTCDNSQYISKKHGDPVNAYGLLYSVPFYDNEDNFKGIISAIFRTRALEAVLLDVPFVPVTDIDRAEAEKLGFRLPEEKGDFVLVNKGFGTFIGDSRDGDLLDFVKEASELGKYNDMTYVETLNIKDGNKWELYYRFSESVLYQAVRHENIKLYVKLCAILIISFILLAWIFFTFKKKDEMSRVAAEMRGIANEEGDLTMRLTATWKGETGDLVKWVNAFIERIHDVVCNVKDTSENAALSNEKIVSYSAQISEKMSVQAEKSNSVTAASTEMSQSVSEIASNSSDISVSAADTLEVAQKGGGVVRAAVEEVLLIKSSVSDLSELVSSLSEYSNDIGEIVNVINDIAAQTNLLALNAAIEAARAGEQGRGFAVVADEVRKLAEKTSKSTTEISDMIKSIQDHTSKAGSAMEESMKRVDSGVELSSKAGSSLDKIIEHINGLSSMVEHIASSTDAISSTAEHVTANMEEIAGISGNTEDIAKKMDIITRELSVSTSKFQEEISFFKTKKEGVGKEGKHVSVQDSSAFEMEE